MPKKRGLYRWVTQKLPGGVMTMAYLPELFHLDPGLRDEHVCFLFAPPEWWIEDQVPALAPTYGDDAADVARVALFTAYLDRRSPMPIINDLRFHLQLWRAARGQPWLWTFEASSTPPINAWLWGSRTPRWGIEDPLAVSLHQDDLSEFLVQQTSIFHKENRRGPHRFETDRRLLPHAQGPFEQLQLDFGLAA